MNEVISVFGNITFKDIVVYATALYWLIKIAKKIYEDIAEHHDKKQETESAVSLAKENRDKIDSITLKLDELVKSDRDYKLRSLGDKLFVCYNQAILQGYITLRQLENYKKNEELYLKLGGNGIVQDKYHPEIMGMKVIEDVHIVEIKKEDEDS